MFKGLSSRRDYFIVTMHLPLILKPAIMVPLAHGVQVHMPDLTFILNTEAASLFTEIGPYIKRPFTKSQLPEKLISRNEVQQLLFRLEKLGAIIPVPTEPLWQPKPIQRKIDAQVILIGEGNLASALLYHLKGAGFQVLYNVGLDTISNLREQAEWIIISSDFPDCRLARIFSGVARQIGLPMLQVEQFGFLGTIIHYCVPACRNCYERRRLEATKHPDALKIFWDYLYRKGTVDLSDWPYNELYTNLFAKFIVSEMVSEKTMLVSSILTIDLRTGQRSQQMVFPMPDCNHCWQGKEKGPKVSGIALKVEDLVNPSLGPILSLQKVSLVKDEPQISFWTTSFTRPDGFLVGPIAPAGAAGLYEEETKKRALYEAIERYCANRFHDVRIAQADELMDSKVDPVDLLPYSSDQYSDPEFPYSRYHPNMRIGWVRGISLITNEYCWVPTFAVYLRQSEPNLCRSNSTGLATGLSWIDAVLSGLFEVIERDACMLMWLFRIQPVHILLDTYCDSQLRELYRLCTEKRLEVKFMALSTDIGLPCVMAMLRSPERRHGIYVTVGAAVDRSWEVAARKALIESLANRHTLINLQLKNNYVKSRSSYLAQDFSRIHQLIDHGIVFQDPMLESALEFLDDGPQCSISELSGFTERKEELLDLCCLKLSDMGFQTVVVDITTPDIALTGFRVVRVLIPEAIPLVADHRFPPLGSRRLINKGREKCRSVLKGLNPYPHPFM